LIKGSTFHRRKILNCCCSLVVERLWYNLKPCDLALVENEMNVKAAGGGIFNGFNEKLI